MVVVIASSLPSPGGRVCLYQLVTSLGGALLDSLNNSTLLKHRALPVTLSLRPQSLADLADIDEPPLEELVVDDQIPRRARRQEALPPVARDNPVAGRLVGVALEDVRVEVGRVVRHGPRRDGHRMGAWRPGGDHRRRRPQDLVLGADLLQVALQPLVLRHRLLLRLLKVLQAVLEVFDMAFLALPEGSLAADGKSVSG